jgi:fumarylacetoacetase
MSVLINETHDVSLRCWLECAKHHSQFPIQNLPFAVMRRKNSAESFRGAVAIGNQVIDLDKLRSLSPFNDKAAVALNAASLSRLNTFMALAPKYVSALRLALSRALRVGSKHESMLRQCLIAQSEVEYTLPCEIGDYTDFYTSIHHATSVGKLFRPDNPLLANYKWVPIGYHGRSSTIGISGQIFSRPMGQLKPVDSHPPILHLSQKLDYEVELGVFVGCPNKIGHAIEIEQSEQHIFGFCLLNDWSARDVQAWEYQPLGPFLSKNFASTISPWIVTLEALAPFREPLARPQNDPAPLPYLSNPSHLKYGAFDIQLRCLIQTPRMKKEGSSHQLSQTSYKHAYWTAGQLITHHSVNGCMIKAGDLMGTGTQSGPTEGEAGSLLELTRGGKVAINLSNGETRTFLEDGDTVIIHGDCRRDGAISIGFGEVIGSILREVEF